jgi:hypothetical protein
MKIKQKSFDFVKKYRLPILGGLFIAYKAITIPAFTFYVWEKENVRNEQKIETSLKEGNVTIYDVDSDGYEDYVFDDGSLLIYKPNKSKRSEKYHSTTITNLNEFHNRKINRLNHEVYSLENKLSDLDFELNDLKNNRDQMYEVFTNKKNTRQVILDKNVKLNSIYSSLKK